MTFGTLFDVPLWRRTNLAVVTFRLPLAHQAARVQSLVTGRSVSRSAHSAFIILMIGTQAQAHRTVDGATRTKAILLLKYSMPDYSFQGQGCCRRALETVSHTLAKPERCCLLQSPATTSYGTWALQRRLLKTS